MPKIPKYVVEESSHKYFLDGGWHYNPKFKLIWGGQLICEMTSSFIMENIVRQRFNEMAKRLNEKPFEIDLK